MGGFQIVCMIFVSVLSYGDFSHDPEHMVNEPETITAPLDYETKLRCQMNIRPDFFQWKFYPLPARDVHNQKAFINLSSPNYEIISLQKSAKYFNMTSNKTESWLTIQISDKNVAGDYQCLAHYGASVVASLPWRITIATIRLPNPNLRKVVKNKTLVEDNTLNWKCQLLEGNPETYIEFLKNGEYLLTTALYSSKILTIPSVTPRDSGRYRCKSGNVINSSFLPAELNLNVVRSTGVQKPEFIVPPESSYSVVCGDTVFLECAAVGNPVPVVVWSKKVGLIPPNRSTEVKGGLIIQNVSSDDAGTYQCLHKNKLGNIQHSIKLIYNEPPKIDCLFNVSVDVKQGENLDLDCIVTGAPEPHISWFLNGFSVTNDSEINAADNKIYFRSVEKRHAGNLQIFARNIVNTVYKSIKLLVIPRRSSESTSDSPVTPSRRTHRGGGRKGFKHNKPMVPPSKPTVRRLSDESVTLTWNVSMKHHGLSIDFFKVQYKELGPGTSHEHHNKGKGIKWNTVDDVISPTIRTKDVLNLKPDHWYKFRIAAVYSNNDNKNSPNSDKFFLKRMDFDLRNHLPIPLITKTEAINSTSVRVHWKYDSVPNMTDSGFYVMFNSASSAADYTKVSVDDANVRSFVISNLQPDTVYDIKLRSWDKDYTSEASAIMKARTKAEATTTDSPVLHTSPSYPNSESSGFSKLYIIIAGGLIGCCGIISVVIGLLLFCRKWKQKKNDRDKPGVDDHHIQVDGNEYVVGPKTTPRTNGCVPPNRITITANPLADTDNKNQNMIEMSCLSSQNNNCSTVQASASGEEAPASSRDKKNKNREKHIRNKHNVDANTSGENYV